MLAECSVEQIGIGNCAYTRKIHYLRRVLAAKRVQFLKQIYGGLFWELYTIGPKVKINLQNKQLYWIRLAK